MSESDDQREDRNLAQQYADEYGGSDLDLSLLDEDAEEEGLTPDIPEAPDATDVDPDIANLFWRLVLVFNVAIAALAIGPMLVYFRGSWELGLQVTALGAVTFAYGALRYHYFRKSRDEGEAQEQNG